MTVLYNVFFFLLATLFNFAIFIMLLRILLQLLNAPGSNAVCQFVAKVTNPIIRPLRKVIPKVPYIDLPSLVFLTLIEMIKFITLAAVHWGGLIPLGYLFLLTFADIIMQACTVIFFAVLIRVIMSWLNTSYDHPVSAAIYYLTEPLFRLSRRFIPDISGFDMSPLIVLVVIKIIEIVIATSLPSHLSALY